MRSRLDELEWLICNEPTGSRRAAYISEFNTLWEQQHGRSGSDLGGRQGLVREVRQDLGPRCAGPEMGASNAGGA